MMTTTNPPKSVLFLSIQLLHILSCCSVSEAALLLRGGGGGDQQQSPPPKIMAPTSRIIGGTETSDGQYSYTVSLQDEFGHFCGGSLIARDVVLSASHCQHMKDTGGYKVVIGRRDLDTSDGEEIAVKTEITHPKYNWGTTDYDFMVLILERPMEEDDVSTIVSLSREVVPVDSPVSVMGWGDTAASDDEVVMSYDLRTTEVFVMSNEECEQSSGVIGGMQENYHGQITSNMVCARDVGEDSCQGDSGGPLVSRQSTGEDVQVGIVSWGVGCANANFPGVYARVSAGYDWIREKVCGGSVDPPASFDCKNIGSSPPPPTDGSNAPTSPVGSPPAEDGNEQGNPYWRTIVQDDFTTGFGMFNHRGDNSVHYLTAKNRDGVVRLNERQGQMSFRTQQIPLEGKYSKIKISFSFYAIQPELMNNICLDYWTDGEYTGKNCWSTAAQENIFDDGGWHDDTGFEFDASDAQFLRIRFVVDGGDDVLLDSVTIEGLE